MKRIIILIIITCWAIINNAQNISVTNFKLLENDLTANTSGTSETDQNGETAALIKIVTTEREFSFDCGMLGIVKTKQTPGEIWLYIPRGAQKITIKHPLLGVLRDYYFPQSIEGARTYELIIETGTITTTVRKPRTSQYVVFQLSPKNAIVEFDGELLQTEEGVATKLKKFGSYNYRVLAPNYFQETGNISVNDPNNKHIVNINLKPNFAKVTLQVDNNAEIWVNGELKGVGIWSGNLGVGTYDFEARKANHRSTIITQEITVSPDIQVFSLNAPTPILGEAGINSSPAMADVFIDGKKVGQTPQLITDLLVGQHKIRIFKSGYKEETNEIIIKESETINKFYKLEKEQDTDNIFATNNELDSLNTTKKIKVGNMFFNMVRVDYGTFRMGSLSKQSFKNEKPVHDVTLSAFYIGETEVTQDLWEYVMGNNPSEYMGNKKPVESVSWDDCQEFIKKLNSITGLQFRLPTEAEWEFAARGGNKSNGYEYSGNNSLDYVAWFDKNSKVHGIIQTHDVKLVQPNEIGLFDMSGNVWEWVQDWYDEYPSTFKYNPKGPSSGTNRVNRGGSCYNNERYCRVSCRNNNSPDFTSPYLGLRLAL